MFEIGEIVVYNQYICKIKDIKKNNMTGNDYYVMAPVNDESLIIDLPTENRLGSIKKIMTKKEAEALIKKIPKTEILDLNDKYIEQKYKELIKTGNKLDLIKIIKTSYMRYYIRINNKKKASEKDNIYLKKAEDLLYYELSYSLSMSYDEVKEYISDYCSKNS